MYKRLLSLVSSLAILASTFSVPVFAADVETNLILGMDLIIVDGDDLIFDPADGEELMVDPTFNTGSFETQLEDVSGYIAVVKDESTVVTLEVFDGDDVTDLALPIWDGQTIDGTDEAESICGDAGEICPAGTYEVEIYIEHDAGSDIILVDTESTSFSLGGESDLEIISLSAEASDGGDFDPSDDGDDETLELSYELSETPQSVVVYIEDEDGDTVESFNSTEINDSFNWDGEDFDEIVEPGLYTVIIRVQPVGGEEITAETTFTVAYTHTSRPSISDFSVTPDSFDPDDEDAVIEFTLDESAEVTVEIRTTDGGLVTNFDDYDSDDYNEDTYHDITWDGRNMHGSTISLKTYVVYVKAVNDYGVDVVEDFVTLDNSGSSSSESNSHIEDISFDPSNTFEPAEDEYLIIEFDVLQDLDELQVYAVRGSTEVELFDDSDVDEDNNVEIEWDGEDDDGDYVQEGTWRIEFRSELNGSEKTASKEIDVEYDDPEIDDLFLSKKKFDADAGEFTYIIFKVDSAALVDIDVLEDNDFDEEIEEDLEVEADKWYAIEWDGDNYDEDDDLDIRVTVKNIITEDETDSDKVSVDVDEDDTTQRANITHDYMDPVIVDKDDEIAIYYDIDDDAEVTISIHSGENATGTEKIVFFEDYDHEEGGYGFAWDLRDDDGDKLSNGTYSYKIVAKSDGGTETEKGAFVVGEVGDIDGGGGSSLSSSSSSSSSKSANVIVDGVSLISGDDNYGDNGCAGFNDVSPNYEFCDAIEWAKDAGIVNGFDDGSFREDSPITRMELLKVILEALDIDAPEGYYGTVGFSDVNSSEWYIRYLYKAKNLGIFTGDDGKTTARPNESINRVEALKILFEALNVQIGYEVQSCSSSYSDISSSAWYSDYVCTSKSLNLIDEAYSNYFAPGQAITRGEVAEMLYRLAQL